MEPSADRDLVLRVRRGEVEAFGELVRRYQQSVFNVCFRVLGNRPDAEDLAQEAFLRSYERLHLYDDGRPFGPWIRRLAANLAVNALKKRRDYFSLDEERDAAGAGRTRPPEAALETHQRNTDIHQALACLPPHYRAAIELRHFQGMTYAEMARTLDLPLNTAKSHLHRARKLLAVQLGEEKP